MARRGLPVVHGSTHWPFQISTAQPSPIAQFSTSRLPSCLQHQLQSESLGCSNTRMSTHTQLVLFSNNHAGRYNRQYNVQLKNAARGATILDEKCIDMLIAAELLFHMNLLQYNPSGELRRKIRKNTPPYVSYHSFTSRMGLSEALRSRATGKGDDEDISRAVSQTALLAKKLAKPTCGRKATHTMLGVHQCTLERYIRQAPRAPAKSGATQS